MAEQAVFSKPAGLCLQRLQVLVSGSVVQQAGAQQIVLQSRNIPETLCCSRWLYQVWQAQSLAGKAGVGPSP